MTVARLNNKKCNKIFIENFKHLLRPHELYGIINNIYLLGFPGAFYFIVGVSFSTLLFDKDIATLGILLVTIGDPFAAIIGISFPNSKKLWGDKNHAGTLGSAIVYSLFGCLYSILTTNRII